MKLNPPVLALAVGTFGLGVTEFAPMGMLPVIATGVGVSIPTAGLLVSGYALGALIGAPLMTVATARWSRRTLLILLMGLFTVGNLTAALSSSYAMLLAARILTSLAHGAFFGVGAVVAASVVPTERRAGAVATMFMGLTLANVGGVPVAAWAGEIFGWRPVFAGIAALGLIAMSCLWIALPKDAEAEAINIPAELRVLARRPVLAALGLTVVGSSALFTVFTYIAPILRTETHAGAGFVSAMLILFGIGLTVGNWLGGRFADRSADATLLAMLGGLIILLVLFAGAMSSTWPTAMLIFLWGVASFGLVPPLQLRVMAHATDAPNLASAMNIGAFNLGNALGAALGGGVIGGGFGYPAVSLAGAAMAAAGFFLVLAMRTPREAILSSRLGECA